jgi:hypothetical protein
MSDKNINADYLMGKHLKSIYLIDFFVYDYRLRGRGVRVDDF